ncbi:MAG TPA: PstS family phosphate ABC transporter substrate-binding protein [Dehalococcoidia bacterium]|nr:PstS family phosphate ABC transporter substrate-binding protein [Dehalococcoidia bacterium]
MLSAMAGLAALSAVAFAACGDDDDNDGGAPTEPAAPTSQSTTSGGGGGIDYGSLSGEIRIDGSSTVFPISEAVAEEFRSEASGVRVNVAFSGTGGGFERFCRGEIQVSDASRPIEPDEVQACADAGIDDIIELQVAIDALSVVVNPANDFADCMTVEQLHRVFTGQAQRWSDLDPSWPDDEIVLFFPGTDSGTFDYFVEAVIEGVDETATHTGDGTTSEDDNVLAQGIEGEENGLGYFGFAYFQEAGQQLRAVAIDGGEGCVEPSIETALDGSYQPLSRPLFIYTRESFLRERPEVLGFIKFYIDNANELAQDVGYVPMPDSLQAEQEAKIEPFLP